MSRYELTYILRNLMGGNIGEAKKLSETLVFEDREFLSEQDRERQRKENRKFAHAVAIKNSLCYNN